MARTGNRIRLDFRKTRPAGSAYPIGHMLYLHPDPSPSANRHADLYTARAVHVEEVSALADAEAVL